MDAFKLKCLRRRCKNHVVRVQPHIVTLKKREERAVTTHLRNMICELQGNLCFTCHTTFPEIMDNYIFDVDHIVPWSLHGSNAPHNLCALCPNCHRMKTYIEKPQQINMKQRLDILKKHYKEKDEIGVCIWCYNIVSTYFYHECKDEHSMFCILDEVSKSLGVDVEKVEDIYVKPKCVSVQYVFSGT